MKAVIYTRVSSDEQVKGTSLEFQEQLCRQYCAQRGIEIVELFREEGESAKDLSLQNRKRFLEALEYCRKRKRLIQAFVVLRVDRFARNTEDHFAVRKILLDYGVALHSVTEPIGNKPAEKFIEVVLAGAAEYENAIRRQRCTDGMIQKLRQGLWPWKAPAGYSCAHFKRRGEKKTEPDAPDPPTFPIIQRALREFGQGHTTQAKLARVLDSWGLAAIRGRRTTEQFVDRILGKYLKFYAGILVNPWTCEEIDGLHTAMITKDEMHRILLLRSGRGKALPKRKRQNPEFPLRGTVLCSACGRPLTASGSRGMGGRYAYYHCHKRGCSKYGRGIPKDRLEGDFTRYLTMIAPRARFLAAFRETVVDLWKEKTQHGAEHRRRYERALDSLRARKARIADLLEDGSYTREEFFERKQDIETQITAATIALQESSTPAPDPSSALDEALPFIAELGNAWRRLPMDKQPKFQRLVFPDGISYDRELGFGTARLGLIFELFRASSDNNSHVVDSVRLGWNSICTELNNWRDLRIAWTCSYDPTLSSSQVTEISKLLTATKNTPPSDDSKGWRLAA